MNASQSSRLIRAGALTALTDGLWACVLAYAYGSTVSRLWSGVAAVVFGPNANPWIGVAMHICVAFFWSGVFLVLYDSVPALQRIPTLAIAAVYAPLIWAIMSLGVIPMFTHRMPAITYRWFIQAAGHIVFVALPIVAMIRRARSVQ